jgi:hypothetical protein
MSGETEQFEGGCLCAKCGSTLTCESLPEITLTHFHVGAFDHGAQLAPRPKQYFVEERLA